MKIRAKVLMISILPILILGIGISITSFIQIKNSLQEQARVSLEATTMALRDDYGDIDGNHYYIGDDGCLYNNDYNVTEDSEVMDDIFNQTGIVTSVFYQDTRYSTSLYDENGQRALGTKAAENIYETVVYWGANYYAEGVELYGNKYFVFYTPLYNEKSDGSKTAVGMIFAGYPQKSIDSMVYKCTNSIIGLAVALCVVSLIIATSVALSLSRNLKEGVASLEKVSKGDLTIEVSAKSLKDKDETGDISRSLVVLRDSLKEVVQNIVEQTDEVTNAAKNLNESAEHSAETIEQVEKAVVDIADGAGTQANDTQDASGKIINMGEMIEETNNGLERLNKVSYDMEESGNSASKILSELSGINEQAKGAIEVIYEQTNTTNVSAQKISEAVNLITDIAEETNLLSLNASIEAARAGEQGRGFAVVAGQIQKLAEQSNESARHIESIIQSLIADSTKAVETMDTVKEIMNKQSSLVKESSDTFSSVLKGVEESRDNVKEIAGIMKELNETRTDVTETIKGLSGIAQSNAAAAEETSASTSDVAKSTEEISKNANGLLSVSDKLVEAVKVFKI